MSDPETTCRRIYAETKDFYDVHLTADCRLGFKILYGPPHRNAEILFIGYQPGGGIDDHQRELVLGAHERWPDRCEYAYETWRLAKRMQGMFGEGLLERCVAMNAIFVRSPNIECYKKSITRNVRKGIEEFCLPRVRDMVMAMDPQKIVFIVFEAMRFFDRGRSDLKNSKGRGLTLIGSVAGKKALATLHLSTRISNLDRIGIVERIMNF